MRKKRLGLYGITAVTVLFSAMAGTFVCTLASSPGGVLPGVASGNPATPGNAATDEGTASDAGTEGGIAADQYPATPGNAVSSPGTGDRNETNPSAASNETIYTVRSYDFWYSSEPLIVKIGSEFNSYAELPSYVNVYLEGPDGILEEFLYLDAKWDLSDVDFNREGYYTVTGILDTESCEYPVDWENAPLLSFIIEVDRGGTLSFAPEAAGNTLTLSYVMNEEPFVISDLNYELYESRDGGANWYNITRDSRVWAEKDKLTISGVTESSLFQVTDLRLGGVLSYHSDIVQVVTGADGSIKTVSIIPSGGEMGGKDWADNNWDDGYIENGPYQILDYRIGNPYVYDPLPLIAPVYIGCPEDINGGFYNTISVYYGDRPDGLWKAKILIPVEWNQDELDAIDWNQEGDTIIHGAFSEAVKEEFGYLLKFESMPELTLTVRVYSDNRDFVLSPPEERLYENNRINLEFFRVPEEDMIPLTFDDISTLTVWCSTDWGENWYDITNSSNTALNEDSLMVSYLKDTYLNNLGYSFQIEQTEFSDLKRYSVYITVSRNAATGAIEFATDIGGDRGGGKRYEKPPEGLFDGTGSGNITDSTPTEPTTDSSAETPEELPAETPEETPTESTEESPSESGSDDDNTPESGGSHANGSSSNSDSDSSSLFAVPNIPDNTAANTGVLKTPAPVSLSEKASDLPSASLADDPVGDSVEDPVNASAAATAARKPQEQNTVDQKYTGDSIPTPPSGKADGNLSDAAKTGSDEIHSATPRSPYAPLRLLVGIAAVSGGAFAGLRMIRKR